MFSKCLFEKSDEVSIRTAMQSEHRRTNSLWLIDMARRTNSNNLMFSESCDELTVGIVVMNEPVY